MPKRLFVASDNHFKRQKAPNVKAQGTGGPQFNCLMVVSQSIDVDNIKYAIMFNKIYTHFADMSTYLADSVLDAVRLKHIYLRLLDTLPL